MTVSSTLAKTEASKAVKDLESKSLEELLQVLVVKQFEPKSRSVSLMMDVCFADLVDYDNPSEVAAWQWVAEAASFGHVGNDNEPGVWEFIVNVDAFPSRNDEPIPDLLKCFFEDAAKQGIKHICFYQ